MSHREWLYHECMDQNPKRVLIIDDVPDFLEMFSVKLRSAGYEVETVLDGKSGIAKAKEWHPDLVLLDVEMPEMNGAEVLFALREDPAMKDIKVLFLTNLGQAGVEQKTVNEHFAKELGAAGYVKKTDDLDDILMKIRLALADPTLK